MISSYRSTLLAAVAALCLTPSGLLLAHERQEGGAAPAAAAPAKPVIPEDQLPLDPRFSPDRVKADIAFLADDLLQGRDTGSVGHEIAARFVAERFASLGLKPMGDNGDYLQRIGFQRTERLTAPAAVTISGPGGSTSLVAGVDSTILLGADEGKLDLTAPLVFAGYGLEDKALGLNDYAGLDVKGKVVVLLRGFPETLPSEAAAHLLSERLKTAQDHGAIGAIQIDTDASAKQRPWARRLMYGFQPNFTWVGPDGKAYDDTPGLHFSVGTNDNGAQAIFAGASRSLAQIRKEAARKGARPKGFALKTSVQIVATPVRSMTSSPNVVAMIPGSDPALASEYVILSGHLDHIGVTPVQPGEPAGTDHINNGAMDNAAGVATMLEVARILSQDKVKPRRSVLFVASTGEEKGLLGADYFARHPTVPISKIVGNVDLDMPLLTYSFNDVVAYGAEHSTLGRIVADAVAPMKVTLAPDPTPEEVIFVRSDHYMFVKQGVPAVFLATGYGNGGEPKWHEFDEKYYHQPGDDMKLPFFWRAGARFAEANYRITKAMADGATPPLWLKGDFFGNIVAPNAPKADPAK
ncbi:M20/M25/M40 family metallo-hydrolase [Sphingobium nicotianae]|uniref:M20/M25/M40 family metallo-hydrolase n=1 Tax=Sphingobium nicotianae TaxID=2782607 RepID=A0A9X1DA75_9SPHN|nr:M20/M25/M40 family metallo-hydrolase [Sphingobium nicotianae]MBT2186232.1 M20/M25/M40 family metallo-hydrolase [Sphingobium nicotianae]